MRISIVDVLFLIAFTLWVVTLDFKALTPLQTTSLVVMGGWLGFLVYRLFNNKAQ